MTKEPTLIQQRRKFWLWFALLSSPFLGFFWNFASIYPHPSSNRFRRNWGSVVRQIFVVRFDVKVTFFELTPPVTLEWSKVSDFSLGIWNMHVGLGLVPEFVSFIWYCIITYTKTCKIEITKFQFFEKNYIDDF